jgi:glycosyltransferase involved in cell wall biosynthesis
MPVGGAETLLVNLMRRMDASLIAPEIICLKEPGPLGEQIADEFLVHSRLIGGKWDVAVLWRLASLMIRRKFDVVITVGAGDKMFWGRLAAAVAGVPVIASALHSTGWPDGVGRMNRWLTPITDAFIGVADSHGEFLRDFEKFPAEKVHVIRNGVDCDRFRPQSEARLNLRSELGLANDTPLIGIVAALRSEKNHLMLVRAAARLRDWHPMAHWIIVGDGPERGEIESLAQELGVADRIHLLGTRYDTPEILAALDVFTLCSLNEASPVSILEALACGVPVVATDVGSVSETVIAGRTGLLIESQDTAAMADCIDQLLCDPSLRNRMGIAGRDLVQKTGSLESMVAGYQQLAIQQFAKAGCAMPREPQHRPAVLGSLARLGSTSPASGKRIEAE